MAQYFLDAIPLLQCFDELPFYFELNVRERFPGNLDFRSFPVRGLDHAVLRDDDIPAQPSFMPFFIFPHLSLPALSSSMPMLKLLRCFSVSHQL